MKRCEACGYDKLEEGAPCPSCGSSEGATVKQNLGTVVKIPGTDDKNPYGRGSTYPIGFLYAGRYRIDSFLGRGGMGSVYRVQDTVDNQPMALKILHKTVQEEDGADRFKREIEILSRLKHPAVPKVYGWGNNEAELYFVAEFIDGHDLKTVIRDKGPWAANEAAELVARVADALDLAHSKGIIHRDVKPHNIMISKDGSVRLLDFGVARGKGAGMETLTKTGMIVGTPEYMSPEQFGTNKVDERSDIYSLGVVLYEMLTGKVPFGGQTPVAIAMQVVSDLPPAPRELRKDIPAWTERIVLKCMDKEPKNRYWSAKELAAELRLPRTGTGPQRRRLPGGDAVIEDDSETSQWALVLTSANEKPGWEKGITLRFSERYYKLMEVGVPDEKSPRWTYYFIFWPEQEVFRRVLDYEKHASENPRTQENGSFLSRMKKKLFG